MGKIPTYYLPQPLASRWFVPLETVGLQVSVDSEEQYVNSSMEVEKYCGGAVTYKKFEVALVPQKGLANIRFLMGYIGQENASLFDVVERVLLASGAKASFCAPNIHCKSLYTFTSGALRDGFPYLDDETSFVTGYELPYHCRRDKSFTKPIDYVGTVVRANLFVDVYMASSLDLLTDAVLQYVALDYQISLFGNLRRYDQLINDIGQALMTQGAVTVEFCQT